MRRIAGSRAALVAIAAVLISMVSGVQPTPAAFAPLAGPAAMIVSVDGRVTDIVTDEGHRAYLANPGKHRVDVVDLATGTLEAPIPVDAWPVDLDLSADGATLYAADHGTHKLSVIDLTQRAEVRQFALPTGTAELAVASNGTAFVRTQVAGVGQRFAQIDLVTGAIEDRGQIRTTWGNSLSLDAYYLDSSRDHSRILFSGGAVAMYSADSDTFSEPRSFNLLSDPAGIDRTGSTVVLDAHETVVLDAQLSVQATVPTGDAPGDQVRAFAVDPSGSTAYRVRPASVQVIDLSLNRVTATILPPEPIDGASGTAVSGDGASLVLASSSGVVVTPVSAAVPVPACAPTSPAPGVVGVCGELADVVVDATGHAYASNRALDQIEVVDLATGTLEAPIPVGSQPYGLDLGPDGRTLYVATMGLDEVSVVDTVERREVRRIPLPRSIPDRDGPFSIAVADNGTALVTTALTARYSGVRILQLDLDQEVVVPRPDFAELTSRNPSIVKASAHGSRITAVSRIEFDRGVLAVYTSSTDSFGPLQPLTGSAPAAAAAGDGESRVLAIPGTSVFDADLELQATIPGGGRDVAVNSAGTTGYRVQESSVDVLDLTAAAPIGSVSLPEAVGVGRGTIALTPEGTKLVVLTASGLSIAAVGAHSVAPKSAYSVWTQPTNAGLDAVGSWVVPGSVPTAAAGQLPPSYLLAHYFGFTQSPAALGVVGLVTAAGSRLAAFSVVDAGGTAHTVGVPFPWEAGGAYYLVVVQLGPNSYGGWVYDNTAAAWTFIGQVEVSSLGQIAPATVTTAIWFGPAGASCADYPAAGAYFHPPVGYAGGTTTDAALAGSGPSEAGLCPATATAELAPWIHLHLGT
jgi:YVTN family beta-propeller protein